MFLRQYKYINNFWFNIKIQAMTYGNIDIYCLTSLPMEQVYVWIKTIHFWGIARSRHIRKKEDGYHNEIHLVAHLYRTRWPGLKKKTLFFFINWHLIVCLFFRQWLQWPLLMCVERYQVFHRPALLQLSGTTFTSEICKIQTSPTKPLRICYSMFIYLYSIKSWNNCSGRNYVWNNESHRFCILISLEMFHL